MNMRSASTAFALVLAFAYYCGSSGVQDQNGLSYGFYAESCPQVEELVRNSLRPILRTDPTASAALLRLMFHDCQVQGCDASILIESGNGSYRYETEMASAKNFGVRKREVIGFLKSSVEVECPDSVSCADLIILAAREAVALSGGPWIPVPLGRKDSSVPASYELADALLPSPAIGVEGMLRLFNRIGLTVDESVAIMGSHSLGVTHCANVPTRETGPGLSCPPGGNSPSSSDLSFVQNDPTAVVFDNKYYVGAVLGRGVLRVDDEMAKDERTAGIVGGFAADQGEFFRAFGSAFVKLAGKGVLTGRQGMVRKECDRIGS